MAIMGRVYVWLDRRVSYTQDEVSCILGLPIDDDLQLASRYDLCRGVEETFGLEENSFWELHSTQKIRFSAQMARNVMDDA